MIDRKYAQKCDTQDEIINLISAEISKDSKKKSDILIEQGNINKLISLTNQKLDENVLYVEDLVDTLKDDFDGTLSRMEKKLID